MVGKIFRRFWDFTGLVEILEKYLETLGSTKVFTNGWKNILKLWGLYRTCRNSRKIFSNFRKSWSVYKWLEKYFEAFATLQIL